MISEKTLKALEFDKIKDRAKFKGSKEDVIKENGDLTIWIKKQILRNNIFGVDIDSNALTSALQAIGYEYDERLNKFI